MKGREKFFRDKSRNDSFNREDIILDALCTISAFEGSVAEGYGEPGYTDPERFVVLANWNRVSKRVTDWLSNHGFAIEWCDEWDVVDEKAYRTRADSYSWAPTLVYADGEALIVGKDDEEIIDSVAMKASNYVPDCVPRGISAETLKSFGYIREPEDTFESGWHPGQNDDPVKIAAAIWKDSTVEAVVFRVSENSQFYIKFESYVKRTAAKEKAA